MQAYCFFNRRFAYSIIALAIAPQAFSQDIVNPKTEITKVESSDDDVLPEQQWQALDRSVDRALVWMARSQQRDGSFPTLAQGQPGVTSLCAMAFLAHGHAPGNGPYGQQLDKATLYIAACQKQNGLLTLAGPDGIRISRNVGETVSNTAVYNHAISGLLLSEVYGVKGGGPNSTELEAAISKAIDATLEMQKWPKFRSEDQGGWRYLRPLSDFDSDLSLVGWQLMFLRSAKNAGFDVPKKSIDDAVAFVRRCYRSEEGTFNYTATSIDRRGRAMAGAGILALSHAGIHDDAELLRVGDWILNHNFNKYNQGQHFGSEAWHVDRYHYGIFNCTQAMYQLGGRHWKEFFRRNSRILLENQSRDGSWPAENHRFDGQFGNCYTTALVTLALGAPNQLLPIFQR